jgi:hypothetical protein
VHEGGRGREQRRLGVVRLDEVQGALGRDGHGALDKVLWRGEVAQADALGGAARVNGQVLALGGEQPWRLVACGL